jgi:biotin carboxyl carrier protein
VIEAMKMEIPMHAETGGTVIELRCERGKAITAGDVLVIVQPDVIQPAVIRPASEGASP